MTKSFIWKLIATLALILVLSYLTVKSVEHSMEIRWVRHDVRYQSDRLRETKAMIENQNLQKNHKQERAYAILDGLEIGFYAVEKKFREKSLEVD